MNGFLKDVLTASNTKKFTVGVRDIVLSIYYAVGASVAVAMLPVLQRGDMPTVPQVKVAVSVGLFSAAQHLIRKFFTNKEGVLLIDPETEESK